MKLRAIVGVLMACASSFATDVSSLTGLWSAPSGDLCVMDVAGYPTVHHYRILREVTPGHIELLEWAFTGMTHLPGQPEWLFDEPDRVLIEPRRITLVRASDLVFRSGGDTLQFLVHEGAIEMSPADDHCMEGVGNHFKRRSSRIEPSFDCAKAGQPREKAICASEELSMLDQHLAAAFEAAQLRIYLRAHSKRGGEPAVRKLREEQSSWWAHQLSSCQTTGCVAPLYRARIQALEPVAAAER